MTVYRVQVNIPGRTNVPEDVFVNTFHFRSSSSHDTFANSVTVQLALMYTVAPPTAGQPLITFMSGFCGPLWEVKTYDLADPEPRVPVITSISATTGFGTIANLPDEVACAITYHCAPPITQRRRGRFYLGPLNANALQGTGGPAQTTETRVSDNLRLSIVNTMTRFWSSTIGGEWIVYSVGARDNSNDDIPYKDRPILAPADAPVVGGWVDNAFDTQRRRGTDPTARSIWPPPA